VSGFSEVRRIEAAIKNWNAKELEWSLWYCRMRQACRPRGPQNLKYWSGVEALVKETLAPPAAAKTYPVQKKRTDRGIGLGSAEEA
jgi:hypothetical protein